MLPVHLEYLSFGIGTTRHPIPGSASVDLGVKGAPNCPAFASLLWHTPRTPGHYCLLATLECFDDANPDNNVGQKNVQVGKLHSPATFKFEVRNDASVPRQFELETDTYRTREPLPCADEPPPPREGGRFAESQARWERALRTQRYGLFPVPRTWRVRLDASRFELDAGASREVVLEAAPEGPFAGEQAINVHGFAIGPDGSRSLAGGITVYVQGA
jgi:hypothetical protein